MIKVWVLVFFMSGMQGNNMTVIDDIASEAECKRVAAELQRVRVTPDFSFRCFEVEKVSHLERSAGPVAS